MFNDYINIQKDNKRFKQIINYVNNSNYIFKEEIIKNLENLRKTNQLGFCNDNLLEEIIYIILKSVTNENDVRGWLCYFDLAKILYNENIINDDNEEIENFIKLFKIVINFFSAEKMKYDVNTYEDKISIKNISSIYDSFDNKNNVNIIIQSINRKQYPKILLKELNNYINYSRVYFADERSFYVHIKNILGKITELPEDVTEFQNNINKIFNEQKSFLEKNAGIYDIEETKLKELEEKEKILTSKLENIEKDITKEEDKYLKLKDEISNMLNETEAYKRKKYIIRKIPDSNEYIQLLRHVRKYNKDFKIQTQSDLWFNKEVAKLFGYNFIALSNRPIQQNIEAFYMNNMINIYRDLITINPEFIIEPLNMITYMDEIILKTFSIEFVAKNFNNSYIQKLIVGLITKNQFQILKKLYEINPNFKLYRPLGNYIDEELFKYINIKTFANSDDGLQTMIYDFAYYKEYYKLFQILAIRSNQHLSKEFYQNIIEGHNELDRSYTCGSLYKHIIQKLDAFDILRIYTIKNIQKNLTKYCQNYDIMKEIVNFYNSLSEEGKEKFTEIDFENLPEINKNLRKLKKYIYKGK